MTGTLSAQPSADPIVISCAADDLFAMPCAVTLRSALANLPQRRSVKAFVLDGGITRKNRAKIVQSNEDFNVDIEFIKPKSDEIRRLFVGSRSNYPAAAYLRLLLPELLPAACDKVVYFDSDIIVLGNLEKLWDVDIGDAYMLAAMDAANRSLGWPSHLKHIDLKRMNLSPAQKYLQSGVLVLNLKKWREAGITRKLLDFIAQHSELPYPDMDALNFVLAGKWRELDPRWNQIPCVYDFKNWRESPYTEQELNNVVTDPYIVHYGSHPKPWQRNCAHPLRGLWRDYLEQTCWAGWRETKTAGAWRRLRQAGRRAGKIAARAFFQR